MPQRVHCHRFADAGQTHDAFQLTLQPLFEEMVSADHAAARVVNVVGAANTQNLPSYIQRADTCAPAHRASRRRPRRLPGRGPRAHESIKLEAQRRVQCAGQHHDAILPLERAVGLRLEPPIVSRPSGLHR